MRIILLSFVIACGLLVVITGIICIIDVVDESKDTETHTTEICESPDNIALTNFNLHLSRFNILQGRFEKCFAAWCRERDNGNIIKAERIIHLENIITRAMRKENDSMKHYNYQYRKSINQSK